jgi:hypothetical protein
MDAHGGETPPPKVGEPRCPAGYGRSGGPCLSRWALSTGLAAVGHISHSGAGDLGVAKCGRRVLGRVNERQRTSVPQSVHSPPFPRRNGSSAQHELLDPGSQPSGPRRTPRRGDSARHASASRAVGSATLPRTPQRSRNRRVDRSLRGPLRTEAEAPQRSRTFIFHERRCARRSASVRIPSSEVATVRSHDGATIAPHHAPSAHKSVPSSPRYSNAVPISLALSS